MRQQSAVAAAKVKHPAAVTNPAGNQRLFFAQTHCGQPASGMLAK
jgi:hypothetical protein